MLLLFFSIFRKGGGGKSKKYDKFFAVLCPQSCNTVELHYNEVLGTKKITLLYQVSHYIRVKKQRNIKSWD